MTADRVPVGATRAAVRAGGLNTVLVQVLSTAVTIVLARLLTPEEFGLVAAAQTIIAGAALITTLGLAGALVRERELSPTTVDTVFWASGALGSVVAVSLFVGSGVLAGLVGQPSAAVLVQILAPAVVLQLLAAVPRALLQRDMRLPTAYRVELAAMVAYAAVQIVLASAGLGARSVAIGQLAMAACMLILMLRAARYVPGPRWSTAVLKANARFSTGVLGYGATQYVAKNIDYALISRSLGATALGQYYVAFVLPNILRQRISSLVTDVSWPVMTRAQDDPGKLIELHLRNIRLTFFLGLPAMTGLACLAPEVLLTFFGDQWTEAGVSLSILALTAAFELTVVPTSVVFLVTGRPGAAAWLQLLRCALIAGTMTAVLLMPGTPSLAELSAAVALGIVLSGVAAHASIIHRLRMRPTAVGLALLPPVLPASVMAVGVLGLRPIVDDLNVPLTLLSLTVVGALLFLSTAWFLPSRSALLELARIALPQRWVQ